MHMCDSSHWSILNVTDISVVPKVYKEPTDTYLTTASNGKIAANRTVYVKFNVIYK